MGNTTQSSHHHQASGFISMAKDANQDKIWLTQEGNRWFQRNKTILHQLNRFDWVEHLLQLLVDPSDIKSVTELGCSNGWRLENLRQHWPQLSRITGCDASLEAVEDGNRSYPGIELHQALLSKLPFQEAFDLVIVAGVFCLVDRTELTQSIAEVDRVVADGGFLLIGDFLPDFPQKRPWHHDPSGQMLTYKQDYVKTFEALGLYKPVASLNIDADDPYSQGLKKVSGDSRYTFTLLQKSLQGYYANTPAKG